MTGAWQRRASTGRAPSVLRAAGDARSHRPPARRARALAPAILPEVPDLAVVDVPFISLATVLPAVASVVRPGATILALVKPQFEVGRGRVGKGGVVRDPALRAEAVAGVRAAAERLGLALRGEAESVMPGPKGNREVFVYLSRSTGGRCA